MANNSVIMVATDVTSDAELVGELLESEFDNVVLSTDPDNTVTDFERESPAVFILAFNTLKKAERCYLGLYRLSNRIHTIPHRTLVLCNKYDLETAFKLCKKQYFDNYILFWPPPNDPFRLRFIVYRLLQQVNSDNSSLAGELASQARRLSGLTGLIEDHTAKSDRLIEKTRQSIHSAESEALASLEKFYSTLTDHDVQQILGPKTSLVVQRELEKLKDEGIKNPFKTVDNTMIPLQQWSHIIKSDLEPHLETTRSLENTAKHFHPTVLIVDDDKFQHKLIMQILADQELALLFATSGSEALGMLRRCKPDLILMDINLPGESGIETTHRLKSSSRFADIPVIMVTGHGEKSTVVDSMQAGAVDFIVKPFNKATVIKKIRHYCNQPVKREKS